MSLVAVRIAQTEVRRTLRTIRADRTKLLIFAMLGLVLVAPVLLFGSLLLSTAGEELVAGDIASDDIETIESTVLGTVAVGVVGLTVFGTARAMTTVADIDEPAALLLSTRLRNVVAGLVLKESIVVLLWLAGPVVVLSSAFAWGATAPLVPVFALVALLTVVGTAVSVGFVVGLCLRHLLTVYEPIAQYRTVVFALLGLAYFASIAFGWLNRVTAVLFDLLGNSPLGWPGQLVLVAAPVVDGVWWATIASVAGAAGLALAALAVAVRLGELHWFADPASSDSKTVESNDRLGSLLAGFAARPVRTVTVTAIRRARRAPVRLFYVAYPLLGTIAFIGDVIETGEVPVAAAVLFAVYVAWAAGALFTLNLLGDHGPALPAVLTATVSGREVVGGTVLAGVICMAPLALVVPLAAGLLSPLALTETLLLTAGTVVGTLLTPVLAVGVGAAFPRFGSVRITTNREAVMPSKSAFVLYSLAVLFPLGAGGVLWLDGGTEFVAATLSGLLTLVPRIELTVPESVVTGAAVAVLAAGILAPPLSVRYAVRRFDEYRHE
ncbi:hypothetical protein SAMN05216226_10999 [Halovenus aranensis]|uniref:ABC-2 type transport system permease protein n=1 Tax=Halovenus aranensis TaxID=890420 RepID=A0A1G8WML8_9EURY|nr:hypothetical protein [Halovenus aranensis]SDJ79293.1 hypothetical protein SAMN05216226_10999 [Halovenus aranensis]